jgi:putative iron-regulated protein
MRNVYLGRYTRSDGSVVSGPSVSDLVRDKDSAADQRVREALDLSIARLGDISKRAETMEAYDQMLGEGNAEGNAIVEKGIEALIAQAKELERAVATLGLQNVEFEKSNSLDAPEKVDRKK